MMLYFRDARSFSVLDWVEEEYLGEVEVTFSLVQWDDSHYLSGWKEEYLRAVEVAFSLVQWEDSHYLSGWKEQYL